MIDPKVIDSRLLKLKEYVKYLREASSLSLDEFKDDPRNYGSVERFLQVAIECCIDIGNHIISRLGLKRPDEYRDVFVILGDAGVIPADFAQELVPMASFRNRLVHLYWTVDKDEVYRILQTRLGDFDKFAEHIVKFVRRQES